MTVPSQMSLRRIPEALHLQVRVAYAAAWEALIATHTAEALQFLCEFASRIAVLHAMDLYFQVTAVPEAMQEVVRSRTFTALELESLPPLGQFPALAGWHRFRPDLVIEHQRYRRRYQEKTFELARMVGARAAEAVVATHVENAIGFTRLLKGIMSVGQATDHYLREFGLPASVAQMVSQRVQARVAGEQLTAQYDEPLPPSLEGHAAGSGFPEPAADGAWTPFPALVFPRSGSLFRSAGHRPRQHLGEVSEHGAGHERDDGPDPFPVSADHDAHGGRCPEEGAGDEAQEGDLGLQHHEEGRNADHGREHWQPTAQPVGGGQRQVGPEHTREIRRDGLGQTGHFPARGEETAPRHDAGPDRERAGSESQVGPACDQDADTDAECEQHVHGTPPGKKAQELEAERANGQYLLGRQGEPITRS
jgi:hypothetical protein